ncbi:MmpS family transport accessory protein [Lentzea sp. JNUCC 0626]|uniref:MmpS family transport accessory protein n=1 Tax=Lentzea sp. JNUCC 0626 TaxID=3367513 RepID=UPI0037478641
MSHQPPEYGLAPPLHEVRKAPKGPWIAFLVVAFFAFVAVLAALYGVQLFASDPEAAEPEASLVPVSSPAAPAKQVVVFEVTGTGKAFTVTATAGSSVQTETNVTLPWTTTISVPADKAKPVTLTVVAGADGAEVYGKYTIEGVVVRDGKASGPYGVLTITDS